MGQRSCHKKIGLPLCRGRDNRRKDEVIEYGVTFNTATLQNIITFFLSMLKNVDSKEELEQIGELLAKALEDGKISSKEWLAIGGKNGLGILGGK